MKKDICHFLSFKPKNNLRFFLLCKKRVFDLMYGKCMSVCIKEGRVIDSIYSSHVCCTRTQNKTKISIFLCTNLLLFYKHKQKRFCSESTPNHHQGFAQDPLGVYNTPQTSSCIQEYNQ